MTKFPIAQIVVGLPVDGPFDYLIPDQLQGRVVIGQRVVVSFAHTKRVGFVVGLLAESAIKTLKPIDGILENVPIFDEKLLAVAKEISERYGCSWGEAVELMLPQELRKVEFAVIKPAAVASVAISHKGEEVLIHAKSLEGHWLEIVQRIQNVMAKGQGVIILVADSAQIPYVVENLKSVLPTDVLIHDNQRTSKGELGHWIALKEGRARVIVGLRTAVFAPVASLGLIVMYDEDNSSFKEEQGPFYQTREIVRMRCRAQGCDAVYIGFSPSVELMDACRQNQVALTDLKDDQPVHRQLIDMTNFTAKGPMTISFPMRNSLEKILAQGGRAMVVINRRGHSTYTHCLFCGHVLRCERCSSNLVYSSTKKCYVCRHCSTQTEVPKVCPHCHKNYLKSQGMGVERVAQEVKRIFPMAHVERFDREVEVFPKKFDVLVTTQAVLRMFGRLSVEGVGVLDIDTEFNRLDYRSSHKAFSYLTHLALMAKDRIEVQTFHVDNEVLRHFVAGRVDEFYTHELKLRQELKFPPFAHWVGVMLRGVDEKIVSAQAQSLYNLMSEQKIEGVEVLNPQPGIVPKLRDKFRYTILVRGDKARETLQFVKSTLAKLKKKSAVMITIHVDP